MTPIRSQRLLDDPGTASSEIATAPKISRTQTSARLLTEQIGGDRRQASVHISDVRDRHQRSQLDEWGIRTQSRGRASMKDLLEELADLGFAWRDVARLVGVSVPAVQKWRRGEGATGENRRGVAGLLAACDLIAEHYQVAEVASWFEMPVRADAPVTPIDLWAAGRHNLVFEYGSSHDTPEGILTQWDPEWRERYRSDFEVFEAGDGQLAIRPQGG
jgi:hypothetical protein